ncbi:glutamate receptor 1-like isoform X1, partial [Vespula maculifrons]
MHEVHSIQSGTEKKNFVMLLKILILFFIFFLPKAIRSYEFFSISDKQIPFIIDICKLYGQKSAILLYPESEKEMEMTTMMFKWRYALSREGIATTKLRFSQLQESSYYIKQVVRPFYIVMISNYNAIKDFSLATNTFDISAAMWLLIFMYKEDGSDYCHDPPGNIFHLEFNTEMMVRCGTENILREWYSIDSNHIEINDVATWSLEKGITKIVPDSLYERRHNLQGLVMRAVLVKDSPFIKINKAGELDGIYGRILRELCVTLNFSLHIVSEVEQYGRWNPTTKTWSGAIAELYYGRADISLSEFSMTNARLNAVDFTVPIFNSKDCLFFEKPDIFAIKWSSYFLTFNYSVWIAMFGILIASSILLTFLKIKSGTDRKIGHLLSDNFLEIWGIFCQQGIAESSDRFSLRIAYFSVFLLITILSAAYSATLISFLTTVSHILPFNSLEGFVQDGTYQLAVFRGTAHYDKFANSEDPLAKKLMKLMLEEDKLPLTPLEGFTSICKNRKLAIYSFDEMEKIVGSQISCNVVRIETEYVNYIAIALSKHNPFTDVINFQLQKFFENGIMNRLKNSPFDKKSNDMVKHQPVPLIGVLSLFIFIQI